MHSEINFRLYIPDYKACYIFMIVAAIAFSTIMASKKGLSVLKFYWYRYLLPYHLISYRHIHG